MTPLVQLATLLALAAWLGDLGSVVQALSPLVPKQPPPTMPGCQAECLTLVLLQCQTLAGIMQFFCLLPTFDGSLASLQAYNPQLDCSQPVNLIPAYTTICGQPDPAWPPPPAPAYPLQPPAQLTSPPPPTSHATPPPYPQLPPWPEPDPLPSPPAPPPQLAPPPGSPPPQGGPPPPWGPPSPQPYAQPPALFPDDNAPAPWGPPSPQSGYSPPAPWGPPSPQLYAQPPPLLPAYSPPGPWGPPSSQPDAPAASFLPEGSPGQAPCKQLGGWPTWLPQWSAGEVLWQQVAGQCPQLAAAAAGGPAYAAGLAWPQPCCPGEDAAVLAGAIGNELLSCGASCIYYPLPGRPGVAKATHYWTWSDSGQCWQQADADNPCGFTAAQEGRWASKVDAWWVADTLLQRLQQAVPAAALGGNSVPLSNSSSIAKEAAAGASAAAAADNMSPGTPEDSPVRGAAAAEVTSVRGWLGEELATPWEGHDLAAAGEAVVALAASRFARDALLALPAEDALRVWQEAQAPQRARDCRAAVEEGSTDEVAHCLCGPLEPLIYCRALEALGRGWGLQALAARPSNTDSNTR